MWYENGLPPLEFEELSLKQAGEYTSALVRKKEEEFKRDAILYDGLSKQIVAGIAAIMNDKNKPLKIEKLYPALFGRQNKCVSDVEVWELFLRG